MVCHERHFILFYIFPNQGCIIFPPPDVEPQYHPKCSLGRTSHATAFDCSKSDLEFHDWNGKYEQKDSKQYITGERTGGKV